MRTRVLSNIEAALACIAMGCMMLVIFSPWFLLGVIIPLVIINITSNF